MVHLPSVLNNDQWLQSLRATGNAQASAVVELRAVLIRALTAALRHRAGVDPTQIEDFAQDALLRVLQSLPRFEGRSKFTTWAIAIAIDTAMSQLRRKHWQNISLDALMEQGDQWAQALQAENDTASSEDQRLILDCMREQITTHLTPKQRAAIVGQLEGLSVEELAAMLSTTPGGLYKLLHDARRSLKQNLLACGISAEHIRTAFTV